MLIIVYLHYNQKSMNCAVKPQHFFNISIDFYEIILYNVYLDKTKFNQEGAYYVTVQ